MRRKKREHKGWWNPRHKSEQAEIELFHEYQNPQEALDAIAAGTDERKPVVRAVSPEDLDKRGDQ